MSKLQGKLIMLVAGVLGFVMYPVMAAYATTSGPSFVAFTIGDPGVPGDGVTVELPSGIGFGLLTPFSLATVTDGITITVYPPTGSGVVFNGRDDFVSVSIGAPGVGAGSGFGFTGSTTLNGVTGGFFNLPQYQLQGVTNAINSAYGTQLTIADLTIYGFAVGVDYGAQYLGSLDAVAIGVGQNSVPTELPVEDVTPPVLTVPADQTVEATGPEGSIVNYPPPSATDDVGVTSGPTCSPVSGSLFSIGMTTVSCSAADAAGNQSTRPFSVTVRDTMPPVLAPAGNLTLDATSVSGAVVTFGLPAAADAVDPAPTMAAVPASGSNFAIGTTMVTVTATDFSGNASSTNFSVTVRNSSQMLSILIGAVTGVFSQGVNLLQNALGNLDAGNVHAGCNQLSAFINQVQAQSGMALSASLADQLIASATRVRAALGC